MTDLVLQLGNYTTDLVVTNDDFLTDAGLETAVIVSLFTDRRVERSELPYGDNDQRGWWGDGYLKNPNDKIGSKLWLLQREKMTATTLQRAKNYAEQALQWMIDDRVAEKISVTVSPTRYDAIAIAIDIIRSRKTINLQYHLHWYAQANS